MKLGLLTAAFPELSLEEVAEWASGVGFEAIEIACWPGGGRAERRYSGVCHLDVETLDEAGARATLDLLARHGLTISSLAYYPNNLHPDDAVREEANEHLRRVVRAARLLGVDVVGTFVGRDPALPEPQNLERVRRVWPPLVRFAADHDVRIAIENCPMIFSLDEWPGGTNLAYSPALWRELFAIVPDENFGLNLDPSHLVWQMIDVERAVREFAPRIFHVHAKDLEIDRDGLYEHGVMSAGRGWQVPRIPGLGEVRWDRFVAALYRSGYDGAVSVEHEDRGFEGDVERVRRGFEIAYRTLRPLIA
ncbi:MAG TPA: sugar phosphate isomerase/epimerase [Gaiellaceae bacterium]|nr:sugar phosphate isomerase/epimerase [Gaiellaceae bacterium]